MVPPRCGQSLQAFAIERLHAAALEFDGARIAQAQERARGHVAHRAGRRGDLRLRKVLDAGQSARHARRRGRVRQQELRDALQDVGEREIRDRVDRTAARLRHLGQEPDRNLGIVATRAQDGLGRQRD